MCFDFEKLAFQPFAHTCVIKTVCVQLLRQMDIHHIHNLIKLFDLPFIYCP